MPNITGYLFGSLPLKERTERKLLIDKQAVEGCTFMDHKLVNNNHVNPFVNNDLWL